MLVGRVWRWMVAGLAAGAVFAVATWVSGVYGLTRLLPSPDTRWVAALAIGGVAAGFAWSWGQWWATGSGNADRAGGLGLAEIADGLAGRLRAQWEREAEARGLNDPYPLPVAWTAAEAPLAGDLEALKRLAASGAGWSAPSRQDWAEGPEDLAGGGDRKLADVLAAVPTGRLVVLGEPGAGKTMLIVRLVLDLLHPERRGSGGQIPVLASLASWDPVSQDLHRWLSVMLITGYPDLAAAAPPGSVGDNRFEALLEAGLILPILDGLDEISESARPVAIARINKELKPGEQVVVTCRTEQYRAAVCSQDAPGAALRAAAVQLSSLRFGEVAGYLRTDAGPGAEARWDFVDTLSAGSPVRQALATPLMAGLARAIYNPRPGERARDLRQPAELCDLAGRPAVEAHLFDAFIPAAYRPPATGRWSAGQAEKWLEFLARHLDQTIRSPDLAWWQLQEAVPQKTFALLAALAELAAGLAAGVAAAVVFGIVFAVVFGPAAGVAAGLALGAVFGLVGWVAAEIVGRLVGGLAAGLGRAEVPARGMRPIVSGLMAGLSVKLGRDEAPARGMRISISGLAAGLGAGLAVGLVAWLAGGLAAGLVLGIVVGLVVVLAAGLQGVPGDLPGVTSPRAVLARDRQAALLLMAGGGLVGGLAAGLAAGLTAGRVAGLAAGFTGLLAGLLLAGRGLSMSQTAWPSYMLTRGWLALHHRLPWSLMRFLADAHQRGVLRQAGAVYQFRHLELQHRLATRP